MDIERLFKELQYRTSRSGGAGGQNVNKVETKVEIIFALAQSEAFESAEKTLLLEKLAEKLDSEGFLHVVNQTERTQIANKQLAEKKLVRLLQKSLKVAKPRKASRPSKGAVENRLREKSNHSVKKATRRKFSASDDDGHGFSANTEK
jgi:ribosome-associated protein